MGVRHLLILLVLAASVSATPRNFSSGPARTHLLELYSSEGCSSCPPAEQWLGALRTAPGLWRDFVPVAFHVDYWDRLGWRDRFSRREFTARQYAYANLWGSDSVYTPGFVLDGAEWRMHSEPPPVAKETAGRLTVEYAADGECRVTFDGAGDFDVTVVLLGGGVSSDVRAGENSGRILQHEFVALALQSGRLIAGAAELHVPIGPVEGVARRALAVWVTRRGELVPRQAAGGWLGD